MYDIVIDTLFFMYKIRVPAIFMAHLPYPINIVCVAFRECCQMSKFRLLDLVWGWQGTAHLLPTL